jgi:hypothetical protein
MPPEEIFKKMMKEMLFLASEEKTHEVQYSFDAGIAEMESNLFPGWLFRPKMLDSFAGEYIFEAYRDHCFATKACWAALSSCPVCAIEDLVYLGLYTGEDKQNYELFYGKKTRQFHKMKGGKDHPLNKSAFYLFDASKADPAFIEAKRRHHLLMDFPDSPARPGWHFSHYQTGKQFENKSPKIEIPHNIIEYNPSQGNEGEASG